jgi:sialate O-acetylesterase
MAIFRKVPFLLALLAASLARADVKLPAIFGDHMVLQRDIAVPLWGTADAGESVTVTGGGDKATATAGQDGKWIAKLTKLPPSDKPIDVTVTGKNTITFHDVLVGDVWICSGQSNMELGVAGTPFKDEIAKADNPQIRLFSVPKSVIPNPASDIAPVPPESPLQGKWLICNPTNLVKDGTWVGFPATAYFFGREIQAYTHLPVGLIGTTWGGTPAQPWISYEGLNAVPRLQVNAKSVLVYRANYEKYKQDFATQSAQYQTDLAKWTADNKDALDAFNKAMDQWRVDSRKAAALHQPGPKKPVGPVPPRPPRDMANNNQTSSGLFNGMINPLIPYAIKGAIWYQGESNASEPGLYHTVLPALVNDWRSHWGQGDFPFFVVQLPNFGFRRPDPAESTWAGTREAQALVLKQPNTGIAVTIDIGEPGNIHPGDKPDVGHRLALAAQHVAYGDNSVIYSGPTFKSATVQGNNIRIQFDNIGTGLTIGHAPDRYYTAEKQPIPAAPDSALQGFAIAGPDKKYVWANATIDGDSVVVSADAVPSPATVRYAWADNPACNLYNKEGLPGAPFRTDDIPLPK